MEENKIEIKQTRQIRPFIDGIMVLPPVSKTPHLLAGRCLQCGRTFFPKREICPDCFDVGIIKEIALNPKGKLTSFTIVRRSLNRKTPYAHGYIITPENVQVFALLTGCNFDELRIGMDMEVIFEEEPREEGTSVVIYKYRPSKESVMDHSVSSSEDGG